MNTINCESRAGASSHDPFWPAKLSTLAAIGVLSLVGCSDRNQPPPDKAGQVYKEKSSGIALQALTDGETLDLKEIHSSLLTVEGGLTAILAGSREQGPLWFSLHSQEVDTTADQLKGVNAKLLESFTDSRFNRPEINGRLAILITYNNAALMTFQDPQGLSTYWASSDRIAKGGLDGYQIVERTVVFLHEVNSEIRTNLQAMEIRAAEIRKKALEEKQARDNPAPVPWNMNPANPNGIFGGQSFPTFTSGGSGK